MAIEVSFESDYQSRVLVISFAEGSSIESARDITELRAKWLDALKTWHSPYKALIDFSKVDIPGDPEELGPAIEKLFTFLKGFFLQRAIGYGTLTEDTKLLFPFPIFEDYEEAKKAVGLRQAKVPQGGDLRQQLHFDNHFPQRVVELTLSEAASLDSKEKLEILKSKLLNNLMRWHSPWNLLIDCSLLTIPREQHEEFKGMLGFFKGFFLEDVLGYSPSAPKEEYPFPVYRARHIASAKVKSSTPLAGDDANCATRKTAK